jgi:hypothetical protein
VAHGPLCLRAAQHEILARTPAALRPRQHGHGSLARPSRAASCPMAIGGSSGPIGPMKTPDHPGALTLAIHFLPLTPMSASPACWRRLEETERPRSAPHRRRRAGHLGDDYTKQRCQLVGTLSAECCSKSKIFPRVNLGFNIKLWGKS